MASSYSSSRARFHSPVSRSHHSWSRSCSLARRVGLWEELPRRSRGSRSPSRVSSRCKSASPDSSRRRSRSRSWTSSQRTDEDRQEEKSLLDFVSVVAMLQSLNELPEAPSESRKIRGIRAALEDDDQRTSSYRLPFGWTSGDILANIDDFISSPFSGMRSVLKFLTYLGVRSYRFYRFEGEELTKACCLSCHVTELAGMRSFDSLNKTDVIMSSSEAKDMEAAMRSIVEATSWMDCWAFAMKSLAFKAMSDAGLVLRLNLAGSNCQLRVAKTASTLWANLVLKRCDVVLVKVKDSHFLQVLHGPSKC